MKQQERVRESIERSAYSSNNGQKTRNMVSFVEERLKQGKIGILRTLETS